MLLGLELIFNCRFNLDHTEKNPADLPETLASNVDPGSWRGADHGEDVICLVKKYICSGELSQKPLLVLPHARLGMANLKPEAKKLACKNAWLLVFTWVEADTWCCSIPSETEVSKQSFAGVEETMSQTGISHLYCIWKGI